MLNNIIHQLNLYLGAVSRFIDKIYVTDICDDLFVSFDRIKRERRFYLSHKTYT